MEQRNGAVIYVRSACVDQVDGLSSLRVQEQLCRDYCDKNGWPVEAVFVEPVGLDRLELLRTTDYCDANRIRVSCVVVRDPNRISRNNVDVARFISELSRLGVLVHWVDDPNINQTAVDKMAASMYGTFNQFFSDTVSEKRRILTREAVAAGRFPWPAPIGYANVGGKAGPNIKPDDKLAPLVTRAFELIAAGLHSKAEVLWIVSGEGLVTRRAKRLSMQTFDRVLKNPLYAGWVTLPSEASVKPVRGLHEPIVSQEVFDRAQVILDRMKPKGNG